MPQPAPSPIPEGMSTITPHLHFSGDCADAIDFYREALGATLLGDAVPSPDGRSVWHAMMQIGDSKVMMADAAPGLRERGPGDHTTVGLFLYVEDCDAWFESAVAAGAQVIDEPADMFWGDRMSKVLDPFGHIWSFATHKLVFGEEEMARLMGSGG